jgi:hypothetical protein
MKTTAIAMQKSDFLPSYRSYQLAGCDLIGAATRHADACTQACEAQRAKLDADLASAARDKDGLPDGYWKPVHAARLKAMAATALLSAIMEVEHGS